MDSDQIYDNNLGAVQDKHEKNPSFTRPRGFYASKFTSKGGADAPKYVFAWSESCGRVLLLLLL